MLQYGDAVVATGNGSATDAIAGVDVVVRVRAVDKVDAGGEAVVDEVDAGIDVVTDVVTGLEVVVVGRRLVVTEVVTGA